MAVQDGFCLEGTRCRLRPWRLEDVAALSKHVDNRKVWRGLYDIFPHPYTEADARAWITSCGEGHGDPLRLAIEVEGEAGGGIGLRGPAGFNNDAMELGYFLGESLWGQGIATEAVRLVCAHGFDALEAPRIEARVYGFNPASGRVLEKCGFQLEGRLRGRMVKDGERTDQLIYGLLPGELTTG